MERFDVVIAGGGPAGLSTALHLERLGLGARALVIEKARYPRHKLCGGGITEIGLRCLTGLGLDVGAVGRVPIDEIRMLRGHLQVGFRRGHDLTIVRRDEFDAYLATSLESRGVALHQGEAVLEVQRRPRGVTVTTDQGRYEAKILVVSDGSPGTLKRKLGLDDKDRVARAMEILTPVEDDRSRALYEARVALFDFTPAPEGLQGYYWDFPCVVDGRPHINRGVFDARTSPERPRCDLKQILADCLAQRGIDLAKTELMGAPIHWFDAAGRFSLPRVLLVGDTAGADPLIGEGIAFALCQGGVAADAIADALARKDFSFSTYGARLLASEVGDVLAQRVDLARDLYRHKNPMFIPSFVTRLGKTFSKAGLGL